MKLRRDPFQAIADPTRRDILVMLAAQSMTAGTIARNFDSSRPTISKHLQVLYECDLVTWTQEGREMHYELKMDRMAEVDTWLRQFREIWATRFSQLDDVLASLQTREGKK